jgi:tripartite-type tricarboxylate transporter receptor subunit TctC
MRTWLAPILATLGLLLGSAPSQAQDAYPTRALRLVVPLPPGGPTDFLARTVAQHLSASLGQPVVVDNKPGADGAIAARDVMAAPADGHTLLFAIGSMLAAPLQSRPPAFDWLNEFAPVGKVGRVAFCLMVHPALPAQTVAEFVTYARANPDKLNFSTSTTSELMAASQFMKATGIRMTRVPYKGGTQAMPDLLAGRIQVMFGPASLALPHAKTGALRVLATLLPQRSAALPDVPTIGEAGHPDVSVPTWQALFVPARTPRPVVARLAAELGAALARPEVRAEFERRALAVETSTPQELAATVVQDQAAWTSLIAEYGLGRE